MSHATKNKTRTLSTSFEGLVGEWMPSAIHDKVAYHNTLEIIDALARVPRHTAGQLKYLDTLGILVEAYEKEHYPIGAAGMTPLEMLKSFMEDHKMTGADLGRLLGVTPSAASLILCGKRSLTADHIKKLTDRFKVSADAFL